MMKNNQTIHFISEVAGKRKIYIALLTLIQAVNGVSGVFYAIFLRNIIDEAVNHNKTEFWKNVIYILVLIVVQLALRAAIRFLEEYSKSAYENSFKERLFKTLLYKDYASVTGTHSGEWINRLTSDTAVVAEGLATIIPGMAGMVVKMIAAVIMILIIDIRFIYVLVPAAIILIVFTYLFRKRLKSLHKKMQEKDGKVRVLLQEVLGSLLVVKAFAREDDMLSTANDKMTEHRQARMEKNRFSNICNVGFGGLMNGAYVAGAVYCGFRLMMGTMSYGTLMAVLQLIGQIQGPSANITGYFPKYFTMIASAERLMEAEKFEDDCKAEKFEDDCKAEKSGDDCKAENDCKKELLGDNKCGSATQNFTVFGLENACFGYDDKNPVLNNFNLEVRKNEFVAFTGLSGCGKSTVLKLLMSLYHLNEGESYITLENGEKLPLTAEHRNLFAYVPQGNNLMTGTIREIVAFSDKDKMKDDAGIKNALKIACAEDFINGLEKGIDTELGERGSGLSEGQTQRVAIARAVYSGRPVLLLDESTSALDASTERKVLENIKTMTDKTVIIVTHRPAALELCDRRVEF